MKKIMAFIAIMSFLTLSSCSTSSSSRNYASDEDQQTRPVGNPYGIYR